MLKSAFNPVAALLLSGTLLAACQAGPPKTQDEAVRKEAVVKADSSAAAVANTDSVPTIAR